MKTIDSLENRVKDSHISRDYDPGVALDEHGLTECVGLCVKEVAKNLTIPLYTLARTLQNKEGNLKKRTGRVLLGALAEVGKTSVYLGSGYLCYLAYQAITNG